MTVFSSPNCEQNLSMSCGSVGLNGLRAWASRLLRLRRCRDTPLLGHQFLVHLEQITCAQSRHADLRFDDLAVSTCQIALGDFCCAADFDNGARMLHLRDG